MASRDDSPRPPNVHARLVRPEAPVTDQVARLPQPANVDGDLSQPFRRQGGTVSPFDHRVGQILLGRYRLDRLVGKGGMGRVYLATQFPLNRPVAIKILDPEFQKKDSQFVRRFHLEAASSARLSHPNTITVYDYGNSEAGELFIAMEFLRGRPLSRVISSESPLHPQRTLHISVQIARALREAHSKGIIHRDLKPGNILLLAEGDDPDFVKVLDFGLVKLFGADRRRLDLRGSSSPDHDSGELTQAGMFLGSPKYMSPEQIQGADVDPRTDIYSLGILMYQMTCGRPPFIGDDSVEIIYRQVHRPPAPFAEHGVDAPPEFEAVVQGCLAKHPDDRVESMSVLLGTLRELQRDLYGAAVGFPSYPMLPTPSSGMSPVYAEPSSASLAGVFQTPSPRWISYVAVIACVVLFGLLAYLGTGWWTAAQQSDLSGALPAGRLLPNPPDVMTEVHFVTDPPGALVSEDGVDLGRSPLSYSFPEMSDEASPRRITFVLDGYQTMTRAVRPRGSRMEVRVGLISEAKDQASVLEGQYKENPY